MDHDRDPCRAASGVHLSSLMQEHKAYVFSLIQKFNQEVDRSVGYTQRDDIIVITDEAHRTQYGTLALNLRDALPNASYIGFTGTPLFTDDEITRRVFGEYVSTYDFQRAVDDNATVPLYYDARGDKLGISIGNLNEKIAEKLEEIELEDIDTEQRLERALKSDYHVVTSGKRLTQIAQDFVKHYSKAWESGKAMFVCIDKVTCGRMHKLIEFYWEQEIHELRHSLPRLRDEQEEILLKRKIQWMEETRMALVVSEEQGEVKKFEKWDIDITPHRKLIKEGMDLPEEMRKLPQFQNMQRVSLEDAFKNEKHPFRVAIVCAMWLTGFDVPSLATLYLDKPLKAHTLMQAIARANRVNEGKENGKIVDYCGVLKHLRKALATFGGVPDGGRTGGDDGVDPAKPEEELLERLRESIQLVRRFLSDAGAYLRHVIEKTGFEKNAAIAACKEAANRNDETRKHFEILCRNVLVRFKSCINAEGVHAFRQERDAINVIYKSLQRDRNDSDISGIVRYLHRVVDEAIETQPVAVDDDKVYDISKIDFDRLRKEFERVPRKNTTVQNMRHAVEQRLKRLLEQNPLRTDFQQHYENIVAEYNREKDRLTIEKTFEALIDLVNSMNEEENRAAREGLDEESLAVFDLLKKPDLSKNDIKRIKAVAVNLLDRLKAEKLRVDHWRDKESTRDAVSQAIHDFLYSDKTGLPEDLYEEEEIVGLSNEVFRHVFRAYPKLPSPIYQPSSAA